MVRRKGSARIEAGIASFVAGTRDLIAPWLAGFGFSQGEREVGRWTATVSFTNGTRYVRLSANCDPRDAPSYSNVVLGEGDLKGPEVDWNGVALWRLARDQGDSEASDTRSRLGLLFQISSSACERISRDTHWDFCEGMCPPSIV